MPPDAWTGKIPHRTLTRTPKYVARVVARHAAAERHEPPPAEDELAKLRATVAKLGPELRQLMADKFGLGGNDPKSCEELAGGLVTRSAIHLKVKKVLGRLRGRLAGER
jgi:hypothetical protein